MKFWALLALAASVAAIPLEGPGVQLHKRDGARKHIGYRIVSKVCHPHFILYPLFHLISSIPSHIFYSIPYVP